MSLVITKYASEDHRSRYRILDQKENFENENAIPLENTVEEDKELSNSENRLNARLLKYSEEGNILELSELFKKNVDINTQDEMGETPLHKASRRGHIVCMTNFLNKNANMYAPAKNGSTPMTCAIECGRLHVIKLFLARNYDLNYPLRPPLKDVCWNNEKNDCACTLSPEQLDRSVQMAQFFLQHGALIKKSEVAIFKPYIVEKEGKIIKVPCRNAIKILINAGVDKKEIKKIVRKKARLIRRSQLKNTAILKCFSDVLFDLADNRELLLEGNKKGSKNFRKNTTR